jgi:hypothetical protein
LRQPAGATIALRKPEKSSHRPAALVILKPKCNSISIAILYDTSKIMHYYSTDQHVAAVPELFAPSLLFWYVLRIVRAM